MQYAALRTATGCTQDTNIQHMHEETLLLTIHEHLQLKSYLHKVDTNSHPSPLFLLCNTHPHNTHPFFKFTHIRTTLSPLDLWTDPVGLTELLARWTEKLAGEPQAGRSLHTPHPTSKGYGSV